MGTRVGADGRRAWDRCADLSFCGVLRWVTRNVKEGQAAGFPWRPMPSEKMGHGGTLHARVGERGRKTAMHH